MNTPKEQQWFEAEVYQIIQATHNTKRFFFKVPTWHDFHFTAGQFVTLFLPISDVPKKCLRSYSIASAPHAKGYFELIVVLNPDGVGSKYLIESVKEGDVIKFSSPLGKFILPQILDINLTFICTGTGVAPFRSMIQHALVVNKHLGNIDLIFGTRYAKDLLYSAEFEALEKKYNNFKYYKVLSRDTPENWDGYTGYVHDVYQNLYTPELNRIIYLCGWNDMVLQARQQLIEMGFKKEQIRIELYG